MSGGKWRVYCAGPLFNGKEKEEMLQLADAFEKAGFDTFLPQRDGLELTRCVDLLVEKGADRQRASRILSAAIFALDTYQVIEGCHAIVANLNGRVPDEGAVAEAAIAWSAGKVVVAYKTDSRTAFGGQDNPLVAGLFNFTMARSCEDAVERLRSAISDGEIGKRRAVSHFEELQNYLARGRQIWEMWSASRDPEALVTFFLAADVEEQVGTLQPAGDCFPNLGADFNGAKRPRTSGSG